MTSSNKKPGHAPDTSIHDDDALPGGPTAGQRRRRALQEFLRARDMRLADLARSLGLTTANAFYNFTNGYSDALSLPMIERILDVHPDGSFEELTGRPPRSAGQPPVPRRLPSWVPHLVVVRMEARAGLWRGSTELPPERTLLLPLPRSVRLAGAPAYGVIVATPGAERVYPAGSLLVVRPHDGRRILPEGARVIVHHRRLRRVEVTVREVRYLDGELWLASCSTAADHQQALRPTPPPSRRQASTETVDIAGAVIWALVPETGVRPA